MVVEYLDRELLPLENLDKKLCPEDDLLLLELVLEGVEVFVEVLVTEEGGLPPVTIVVLGPLVRVLGSVFRADSLSNFTCPALSAYLLAISMYLLAKVILPCVS